MWHAMILIIFYLKIFLLNKKHWSIQFFQDHCVFNIWYYIVIRCWYSTFFSGETFCWFKFIFKNCLEMENKPLKCCDYFHFSCMWVAMTNKLIKGCIKAYVFTLQHIYLAFAMKFCFLFLFLFKSLIIKCSVLVDK